MYLSTAIVLLGGSGGLLVPAAQHYRRYASLSPGSRRDLQTCNQTYGTGFVACGNSSSVMCFNPSQGQLCCTDGGYCERGQSCAPVPGYCCGQAEDLPTCAKNAGFELPAGLSAAESATESGSPPPASDSSTTQLPGNTTTSDPPPIQMSVARKERWTLVYMTSGIGIVGLIMASF